MKKYKSLIIIIISLIVLLLATIGIYLYKNNNDTTIPKDAKCVAEIYQSREQTKRTADGIVDGQRNYSYEYEFFPKGKNKYIVRKSKIYDVGITDLYIAPTIMYTKIVKKSDISEIEKEIQNDINIYNIVRYTYYDKGNKITCNSLQELYDKLF